MRSFLGVGAPEALLVAVVALVVFGPKGLADVSGGASSSSRRGAAAAPRARRLSKAAARARALHTTACSRSAPAQSSPRTHSLRPSLRSAPRLLLVARPQAAKSLGQTLRAFQPTIREVVEVSQEIKGTLEQVRLLLLLAPMAHSACRQHTAQAGPQRQSMRTHALSSPGQQVPTMLHHHASSTQKQVTTAAAAAAAAAQRTPPPCAPPAAGAGPG